MVMYGVYGGKSFGGSYPMVNKYFKSLDKAKKFMAEYKLKYPHRKLIMVRYND